MQKRYIYLFVLEGMGATMQVNGVIDDSGAETLHIAVSI